MRKNYKKHLIRFCPLCGSDVVTHLGNGAFVCGTLDVEAESQGKVDQTNTRCNRAFTVLHPVAVLHDNVMHRKAIGSRVTEMYDARHQTEKVTKADETERVAERTDDQNAIVARADGSS